MGFFSGILDSITGNGILGAATSLIGGMMGQSGQEEANWNNAVMAQGQRDWQQYMSNTSYQRAVKDMQLAGLNPMLAYQQGGASTPSGGVGAPMQNAKLAGIQGAQASAQTAATVANAELLKAQAQNVDADTTLKRQEIDALNQTDLDGRKIYEKMKFDLWAKLNAEAESAGWKTRLDRDEWNLLMETIKNAVETRQRIQADTGNINVDTALKRLTNTILGVEAQYAKETGTLPLYARDIGRTISNATDATTKFFPATRTYRNLRGH